MSEMADLKEELKSEQDSNQFLRNEIASMKQKHLVQHDMLCRGHEKEEYRLE